MSRASWLLASVLGLFVATTAGLLSAADDPPANPPPRPRLGFGGGTNGMFLLRSEVVQKDLNLTDEQKESITKLQEKARDAFQGLQGASPEERRTKMQELQKEQQEQVTKILDDKQRARFKEITLQGAGPLALANKEVAESLKLTDDQTNKIKGLMEDFQKDVGEAMQSAAGGGDRAAARDKITQLRKDTNEKILGVLKDDQKSSFEKMQGKKIDLPAGGLFGAGRPRGGN